MSNPQDSEAVSVRPGSRRSNRSSKTRSFSAYVIEEDRESSFHHRRDDSSREPTCPPSSRRSSTKSKVVKKSRASAPALTYTIPEPYGHMNSGFQASAPSSIYGGSVNSLPVIREQYCCCSRWTRREKLLGVVVVVLVVVVIGLVLTVVMINNGDHAEQTFRLKWPFIKA